MISSKIKYIGRQPGQQHNISINSFEQERGVALCDKKVRFVHTLVFYTIHPTWDAFLGIHVILKVRTTIYS